LCSPLVVQIAKGMGYRLFPRGLPLANMETLGDAARRSTGHKGRDTTNQHGGFEWDHQAAFPAGAGQTPSAQSAADSGTLDVAALAVSDPISTPKARSSTLPKACSTMHPA